MSTFVSTPATYRQGSTALPGRYYTSPGILEDERRLIHARLWSCAGRASSISAPGEYVVRTVAGESLILVRDHHGTLRAFFNVCRHRGTRLCRETSGRLRETIQCPYHAWTYALDGRLLGAPHMQDVEGFDRSDYPLHTAAVAEWEGFVFVNIHPDPEPFESWFAPMLNRFDRYALGTLRTGHSVRYEVHANWKLVFQNYSECLHCPMIHPELSNVLPYQSGANDLSDGPFLGGYMEIAHPNESATLSGRACGRRLSASLGEDDLRRALYYSIMPNMLLSLHPDYVNYYIITPVDVDRTMVESEWLFSVDNTNNPEFNPQDAIGFWDITNRQDWDIVAASQLGIASSRYVPGPYSPRESIPAAWDREYLKIIGHA